MALAVALAQAQAVAGKGRRGQPGAQPRRPLTSPAVSRQISGPVVS
jgi:hypothetical protein